MSQDIAEFIGWINPVDSTETIEATNDKRYKQLFVWVNQSDSTIPPWMQDTTKVYETRFPWVHRSNIWNNKYYRGENGKYTNVPVIRLPEMYLTKAIIEFRLNRDDMGLGEVNVVRNRAGLTNLTSVKEEDIHKERIKELAFEGDRLYYLKSLKMSISAGDRDDQSLLQYDDNRLYWPIPEL
jgi:hypothetical protein